MACGDCYYVGWTAGSCRLRCRHPYLDCELDDGMWQTGCDFKSPNKVIGNDRPDKIMPGKGRGEKDAEFSK